MTLQASPLLLLLSPLLSALMAGSASQIPLTCQWSEWQDTPGLQCLWRNDTVGIVVQDRPVNKFVTYCAQLAQTRSRMCESSYPAETGLRRPDMRFLEPTAFMPSSEHQNDEPVVVRHAADRCTDDRCAPLNGQWCYWIVYGGCDFLCRHAAKNETEVFIQKQRLCNCPRPRNNGRHCEGPSRVRERCECASLAASLGNFLRSTEGILIATGAGLVVLVLVACCVSRACCDADDAAEDFKIGETPQQQQHQQQPQPLLLNFDDPDVVVGHHHGGGGGGHRSAPMAETDLSSLPGNATDSTAASDETASAVVRLPDCLLPRQHQNQHQHQHLFQHQHQHSAPPPLPPKRYKQKRQHQSHRQPSSASELQKSQPIQYTPPFPDEI